MSAKQVLLAVAATASLAFAGPALAGATVYTDRAAFDAAVSGESTYLPVADATAASSYSFGPVVETAGDFLNTYTGDYGPGVREVGAFGSPVTFTSTQTAIGLELGYFIGPVPTTYTIDGISGSILVPDNNANPNTIFIGFTDNAPITVSFGTNSAEFDTLRVVSANVSAAPEPLTWLLLMGGVGAIGLMLRRVRTDLRATASRRQA